MRRSASFRGNVLGAAAVATVLAAGVLMVVGQAPALAAGTPSPAESLVEVSPNPALLGPNEELSFEVSVTVKEAGGDPVEGDEVALSFEADGMPVQAGELSVSPAPAPSPVTNSQGRAHFKVSCVEGYCSAGTSIVVIAIDETAHVKLGGKTEEIVSAEVATVNGSDTGYTGESATVRLKGVTSSQKVSLIFEGSHSPITLAGECETSADGDLSQFGEVACTFPVPPGSVGSTVPVEIKLGGQPYTSISFKLIAPPSLTLLPATGHAGTVIEVKGEGFPRDENLPITFTAAGASAASASVTCLTNGLGEVVLEEVNNEITGQPCRLTVPEGTVRGEATVAVSGYPTVIANFNVTVSCATAPSQPGCSRTGISIDSSNLVHSEIYVGATTAVTIDEDYSDGSSGPLTPTGGSTPTVKWSTEPEPSGAITLNGVSDVNQIGLTANAVTSSPGVLQAEYEGFTATSLPLSAVVKPCDDCFSVNGALLNVKAQAPEGLGSKPIAGAIADIVQGEEAKGGRTGPPPCIPETVNGVKGCSDTGYEHLPASAAHTCTTEGAGACELIAEEGTLGESTEVEDTVTLTAPEGYSVTEVKGCHEKTGPTEAPVCHVLLPEFSEPSTITFELKRLPELTVKVGGPEVAPLTWANGDVDGAVATITPVEGTLGKPVECPVEGGEEEEPLTSQFFAAQASCSKVLKAGTYEVLVGPKFTTAYGKYRVTSEDPKKVTLKAGEQSPVSFNTVEEHETELIVKVGGPEVELLTWENGDVDGAVATITPIDGTPGKAVECTVGGGEYENVILGQLIGEQASCGKVLEAGTYEVSVGPKITTSYGSFRVTSEDPKKVTLKAGEQSPVSFNTTSEYPLTSVVSGKSTESSTPAEVKDGPLTATASGGTGTVTVGQYESDPVGVSTFISSGQYVDVFLARDSTFTSLSFTDCDLNGATILNWWNPQIGDGQGGWEPVSDETTPSGNPPCITVTITKETTPDLAQLTGTVFGAAVPPTSDTGSGGSSTPPASSATPTTTTPPAAPAATGSVSLDGSMIAVKSGGNAQVKLTCTGPATCAGTLTLTAKTKGKGKKQAKTETIGTAAFSIPMGKTATVKLTLNAAGKTLLQAAHGKLSATLTILESSPSPTQANTDSVHLTQQKATKGKKGKKVRH